MDTTTTEVRTGRCHCGRVEFRVRAKFDRAVVCDCSICTMKGFLHLIVTKDAFTLVKGSDALVGYSFNTHTAKHLFCGTCGISSFYVPRSHPDGYSVNMRCVEGVDLAALRYESFGGAQWEANIAKLRS